MPSTSPLHDPVVIACAWLVIVGRDGHRLHEELLTAGCAVAGGAFGGSARESWTRRWRALWLLRAGRSMAEVAAAVGVAYRTIQEWVR